MLPAAPRKWFSSFWPVLSQGHVIDNVRWQWMSFCLRMRCRYMSNSWQWRSQSRCDNHYILYRWPKECTAFILFSLAELSVHTSFSSVVVMFIYKYTHTMNPLTMMLLKMVENSVWNLEKVLHNFFPQIFQLIKWNILFSLHDLPWVYSCSICTHTTYLISLTHSSHKESFNLNGFTLTFLATQIRVPHTQRCVCIVSVPCTLTWTKWCTENYFLYTLCRVSIK